MGNVASALEVLVPDGQGEGKSVNQRKTDTEKSVINETGKRDREFAAAAAAELLGGK